MSTPPSDPLSPPPSRPDGIPGGRPLKVVFGTPTGVVLPEGELHIWADNEEPPWRIDATPAEGNGFYPMVDPDGKLLRFASKTAAKRWVDEIRVELQTPPTWFSFLDLDPAFRTPLHTWTRAYLGGHLPLEWVQPEGPLRAALPLHLPIGRAVVAWAMAHVLYPEEAYRIHTAWFEWETDRSAQVPIHALLMLLEGERVPNRTFLGEGTKPDMTRNGQEGFWISRAASPQVPARLVSILHALNAYVVDRAR